jgi:hypothetical protein
VQGDLDHVADIAIKGNAITKIDFKNVWQVFCAPVFDAHRDDRMRAFPQDRHNTRGKDFRSILWSIACLKET